jgi:FkbM family methyltransferase
VRLVEGWYIPEQDAAIHVHPVRHQMAKDIRVIDVALKHVIGRDCVIQAGARIGLWPRVLARHFRKVIAFEPETRNFDCALMNLQDCDNVDLRKAALGAEKRVAKLAFSDDKSGSHFIDHDGSRSKVETCDVTTIDALKASPDAIFLDVEGYELFALQGGLETIEQCKPLLILEQNDSRLRYGIDKSQIVALIAPFGYRAVDRCGKDIIYSV